MRYILLILLFLPILAWAQGEMLPYLQTPTSSSMYVCWKAASGTGSSVQYGTTSALGTTNSTGGAFTFSTSIIWHWVKLTNLLPDTRYYYKCITGSQVSAINSFTTIPASGTAGSHLRVIMMGDTRTNTTDVVNLVSSMQTKLQELYGTDWRQKINLICHVGDSANSYSNASSGVTEFLVPFSPLTSSIPMMVTPGNHEAESANFYNFMKTEDFAGPEGKKYYSFDLDDARFIFINSNVMGTTQANWVQSKITDAQANSNLDFVFGITHHHGHAESQPSQNNSWTQNTISPMLGAISKPTMLSYGHAHAYERGTMANTRMRMLLCGAGGAPLEDYPDTDQIDYPEINAWVNWWSWVLVDIDLNAHSYTARMFTTGSTQVHPGNIEYDSWSQNVAPVIYLANAATTTVNAAGLVTLGSTPAQIYAGFSLMSTQFQVSTNSAFSSTLVDISRNWKDIYGNSGSPNYTPIDVNAGIDLKQYAFANGILQSNATYYWRVRYRSQNADWGSWSTPRQFVNSVLPGSPTIVTTPTVNGLRISWTAIPSALHYKIYSATDPDSTEPWTLLATITGTTYTYTGTQIRMFFRVTASTQ